MKNSITQITEKFIKNIEEIFKEAVLLHAQRICLMQRQAGTSRQTIEKYRDNPYRAVNFSINENGNPICPNGKEFKYLFSRPVRGNKYGRTEELYQCEDCSNCLHKKML